MIRRRSLLNPENATHDLDAYEKESSELWSDKKLQAAGKAFAELRNAQMDAFLDKKTQKFTGPADYRHKAKTKLCLPVGRISLAGCRTTKHD